MTKRYYICRRIGTGVPGTGTPFASELRRYIQANWPGEPHFIKQVISHTIPWVIMKYDLSQTVHDDVMANLTGIFDFPVGVLDRELSTIPPNKRNAIRNKLENMGFDFDWATGTNTVRDVLKYLFHSIQLSEWADVQILNKNFDMNTTVADVPAEKRQLVSQHLQDLGVPIGWITGATTISEIVQKIQYLDNGTTPKKFGIPGRKGHGQWLYNDEDTE